MNSARWRTTGLLACLLLATPALAGAQAQNEVPRPGDEPYQRHPEAEKAIDQLKSPYCPGLMLEVCPSAGGAALRDSLETLADQGWSADSIVEWVLANHGEEWRALPKREGKALVAWVVPPLVVVTGILVVVLTLAKMRKGRAPDEVVEAELTAEEEEKLRKALEDLEAEEEAPFI